MDMAQELCEETSQICTEELFLRADIEREIFGQRDDYVRRIENELGVTILSRNGAILVSGGKKGVRQAVLTLNQLAGLAKRGTGIEEQNVNYVLEMKKEAEENPDLLPALDSEVICHTTSGKPIKPKTIGQEKYIKAIRDNLIIFANGPAGTGKTFLAMAMAITAFQNKEVERIILTRPAIEAGEKLGFLPGDLQSKVDPYLRPLYDALYQIMGAEKFQANMEKGLIVEGQSIDLYNAVHFTDYQKNTVRLTNDWITGECDIIIPRVKGIDIKSSWSLGTFPALSEDGEDKTYEWQCRGYMMLWEVPRWEVAYCMVNTPDELIKYEQEELHYVDHIDPALRVTTVAYERDMAIEEKIKTKVEACRYYLNSIIGKIKEQHGIALAA